MSAILLDEKLHDLHMICEQEKYTNKSALWISYAVQRYFATGRASVAFEKAFCNLTKRKMHAMVRKCLAGGLSDDAILENVKKYMHTHN